MKSRGLFAYAKQAMLSDAENKAWAEFSKHQPHACRTAEDWADLYATICHLKRRLMERNGVPAQARQPAHHAASLREQRMAKRKKPTKNVHPLLVAAALEVRYGAKKRRNPADLTPRNNNARKKVEASLDKRVDKLEAQVAQLLKLRPFTGFARTSTGALKAKINGRARRSR